jgi:PAS domain S-box-containing protein
MNVPLGDGKAREELTKTTPDVEVARRGFLAGRNHPDDIEGMIALFRNFSNVSYIARAIAIWGEAEPIVMQLVPIGERLRSEIGSPYPSQAKIDELLRAVGPLNAKLTTLEDEFSYTLGEASRWLEGIVLRLLFITAVTVELTGLLLAMSVSRAIQKGLAEIIKAANLFANRIYSTRAKVFSRDEIGRVASSVNQMSERPERSISDLSQARKKFKGLLESAPDAMVIADRDGTIKLVNAQTEKLFGCGRDRLLQQPVERLIPGRLRGAGGAHAGSVLRVTKAATVELHCQSMNGQEFPAEITFSPLETEEGLLVSAAIRDISERKRMVAQRCGPRKHSSCG